MVGSALIDGARLDAKGRQRKSEAGRKESRVGCRSAGSTARVRTENWNGRFRFLVVLKSQSQSLWNIQLHDAMLQVVRIRV